MIIIKHLTQAMFYYYVVEFLKHYSKCIKLRLGKILIMRYIFISQCKLLVHYDEVKWDTCRTVAGVG
jgi:hypothetical protein